MAEIDDTEAARFFKNVAKGGELPPKSIAAETIAAMGAMGATMCPLDWIGQDIPERQWAVDGWIPSHCVTGLYGDGGVGKSLLAMMLMTCVSAGYNFLGMPTAQSRTFGFFCEDTEDELKRRQHDISANYGSDFSDLGDMHLQSRVGYENILMNFANGIGRETETYTRMYEEIRDLGAKFVVIDTAADTFGGNENARPEVRQYINLLGRLALQIDGTVVLCAHPSRSGLADETGSGGSTAWNNTLRSRLYLRRPKMKDGNQENPETADIRELQKMKSNYSSVGDKITLKWIKGSFLTTDHKVEPDFAEKRLGGIQQLIIGALELFPEFPIDAEKIYDAIQAQIVYDPQKKDERRKRFFNAIKRLADSGHFIYSNEKIYKS